MPLDRVTTPFADTGPQTGRTGVVSEGEYQEYTIACGFLGSEHRLVLDRCMQSL
jgi:hypothetical protein